MYTYRCMIEITKRIKQILRLNYIYNQLMIILRPHIRCAIQHIHTYGRECIYKYIYTSFREAIISCKPINYIRMDSIIHRFGSVCVHACMYKCYKLQSAIISMLQKQYLIKYATVRNTQIPHRFLIKLKSNLHTLNNQIDYIQSASFEVYGSVHRAFKIH